MRWGEWAAVVHKLSHETYVQEPIMCSEERKGETGRWTKALTDRHTK